MVYLSYIIDHYDVLPDVSVFVHGGDDAWHNDIMRDGVVAMLPRLRIPHLLHNGYTNLRCTHDSGCYPHNIRVWPKATEEELENVFNKDYRRIFAKAYMQIMNVKKLDQVPDEVANICCAQFAVSRDRIRMRAKRDYVRMQKWILDSEMSDHEVGWIFEKLWHIIFQENAVQYVVCFHLFRLFPYPGLDMHRHTI